MENIGINIRNQERWNEWGNVSIETALQVYKGTIQNVLEKSKIAEVLEILAAERNRNESGRVLLYLYYSTFHTQIFTTKKCPAMIKLTN